MAHARAEAVAAGALGAGGREPAPALRPVGQGGRGRDEGLMSTAADILQVQSHPVTSPATAQGSPPRGAARQHGSGALSHDAGPSPPAPPREFKQSTLYEQVMVQGAGSSQHSAQLSAAAAEELRREGDVVGGVVVPHGKKKAPQSSGRAPAFTREAAWGGARASASTSAAAVHHAHAPPGSPRVSSPSLGGRGNVSVTPSPDYKPPGKAAAGNVTAGNVPLDSSYRKMMLNVDAALAELGEEEGAAGPRPRGEDDALSPATQAYRRLHSGQAEQRAREVSDGMWGAVGEEEQQRRGRSSQVGISSPGTLLREIDGGWIEGDRAAKRG
mmetsp:Transcript_25011/g.79253  ORF Transcript_25011/g.79253 Transcript_25011/m.79253 type:complete len:328 (+) Transcript_25011:485-1468(+)